MNYDVIGDIHGEADKLFELLTRLGYRIRAGAWRHPTRTAVFVGDFIDRGPRQLAVVNAVRRMVDAGAARAVMGNHELNAIAWFLPSPHRPGDFLRTRLGAAGAGNRQQHGAFLAEVEDNPRLHEELIDWFLELPLWLETDGLRVAHACWHPRAVSQLKAWLGKDGKLSRERMVPATTPGSPVMDAVGLITKGPEVGLPNGISYLVAGEFNERTHVRIRWWDDSATTYKALALLPPRETAQLPDMPAPALECRPMNDRTKPTFFGHYWMSGAPALLSPTMACVDYSVARGGELVAYRWDGEPVLDASKFVATGNALSPRSGRVALRC